MTFHFAYPNVLPRQELFIGCGRYAVFPAADNSPTGYSEVLSAPNTPNRNTLKRAVQLLAPESYESNSRLFHKQDQQGQTYQGDSLDLAWLLAHVLRGRNLQLKSTTDIWCTGLVQLDGSGCHLLDVHPDGFQLKVQAFLAPANQDLLFIIPLANMEPGIRKICRDSKVQVTRLHSFESCNPGRITGKTVLTVAADELTPLLELLFADPASQPGTGVGIKKVLWGGILLAAVAIAAFALLPENLSRQYKPEPVHGIGSEQSVGSQPALLSGQPKMQPSAVPPAVQAAASKSSDTRPDHPAVFSPSLPLYRAAELAAEIRQGDFANLLAMLATDPATDTEELQLLRQQAGYVLSLNSELQYQLADGARSSVPLQGNTNPPVLNPHDLYRCRFNAELPPGELYLYLLQVDSTGSMTVLFPNPQFAGENPLTIGQWPVTVPGGNQWLFLDELPNGAGGTQQAIETLYLFASPWPADDIELLIQQAGSSQGDTDVSAISSRLAARFALRQQTDLPAMTTIRWSFIHGQ